MEADKPTKKQQKRALAEKLWLTYFTQCLFQNDLLSETDRNRMLLKIENRKGSISGQKQK